MSDLERHDQSEQWVRAFNAGYKAATMDLLANGERMKVVESKPRQGPHGEWEQQEPHIESSVIEPARCLLPLGEYLLVPVSKLLVDPTTEEER